MFLKKKSLGQYFLTSTIVPEWMCDAASITEGDVVFEIGPGDGKLTEELLRRNATVYALETDHRAIALLKEKYSDAVTDKKLILIHGDARTFNISTLPLSAHQFKVVANIPYYLSGMLFRTILEHSVQPSVLVFLVQKEVAERISRSEKESLLSLSVKAFGKPTYVRTVSRGHFSPQPHVDSAIISVRNISMDNFIECTPAHFFHILHLGFGQKRKQLLGNLAKQYDRVLLMNIFSTLSIPHNVRGEDLDLAIWLLLAKSLLRQN